MTTALSKYWPVAAVVAVLFAVAVWRTDRPKVPHVTRSNPAPVVLQASPPAPPAVPATVAVQAPPVAPVDSKPAVKVVKKKKHSAPHAPQAPKPAQTCFGPICWRQD